MNDDRKPGDIVYNWNVTKHLLIDVSITKPLATYRHLISGGPGNTAKFIKTRKTAKYGDLNKDK